MKFIFKMQNYFIKYLIYMFQKVIQINVKQEYPNTSKIRTVQASFNNLIIFYFIS